MIINQLQFIDNVRHPFRRYQYLQRGLTKDNCRTYYSTPNNKAGNNPVDIILFRTKDGSCYGFDSTTDKIHANREARSKDGWSTLDIRPGYYQNGVFHSAR